jgi:putative Holliday junction resolvase
VADLETESPLQDDPAPSRDESLSLPAEGRLLGLDFGTKRIGIAVSTHEQTISSPLDNYTRQSAQADAEHLNRLVMEYHAVAIVVGLPVHMSGDEGQSARAARDFGRWVGEATALPVTFWDERYTSALAEQHLLQAELSKKKRKARLDKLAAHFILQSYLNAPDRSQSPGEY